MTAPNRKVDVLILTYNHERFIRAALDSILSQKTSFEFRLVIGDDHSTDGTVGILSEYQARFGHKIELLVNETRLGIRENFMRTWNRCDADYVAFCEGDDGWLTDQKLQRQVDFLEGHRDFNICASRSKIIFDGSDRTNIYPLKYRPYPSKAETISRGMFHTASVVLRRENTFSFPPWFPQTWIVDFSIWVYARQEGRSYVFPDVTAFYRLHGGGSYTSSEFLKRWQETQSITKIMSEHLTDVTMQRLCIFNVAILQCQIIFERQRIAANKKTFINDVNNFISIFSSAWRHGLVTAIFFFPYLALKLSSKFFRQVVFLIKGRRYPY